MPTIEQRVTELEWRTENLRAIVKDLGTVDKNSQTLIALLRADIADLRKRLDAMVTAA